MWIHSPGYLVYLTVSQGGCFTHMASSPTPTASTGLSDNIVHVLAYIFPIPIIWLLVEPYKNSRLTRFHSFQSLFLSVSMIVLSIGLTIVAGILAAVTAGIGGLIIVPLQMIVGLGGLILWVLLVIKAYQGQKWVLPIIGPLAEKQAG